jgi:hypothetical protein
MKLSRVGAAIMMASLSTPLFAASEQSVGTLTSASQGTFVARDGKLVAARSGQSLFAGDRVVTRGKANAKVAMSGCSYALGATSILSVGKGACTAKAQSLAMQDDGAAVGAGTGGSGAAGGVILAAAIAAVGLGVYVAVDENDSSPASP